MKRFALTILAIAIFVAIISIFKKEEFIEPRSSEQITREFKSKSRDLSIPLIHLEDPIPTAKKLEKYFEGEITIDSLEGHFDSLSTASQIVWRKVFHSNYKKEKREKLLNMVK